MKTLKYLCIFFATLLAACATHQPTPSEKTTTTSEVSSTASSKKATKQAASINSWELSGAMAARNRNKGWTASLNWLQQGPNRYQIRLFGPLGGGTVIIEKNRGVITYSDGPKKISAHNADTLLQQQTGIRLPVHALYYWVRGLPAPGAMQAAHYDKSGQLSSLNQAGYTIHYSNYQIVKNTPLPGKIHLQGHGTVIKLAIKHWRI